MLLRLVFLLYAEDEELMPGDSLYGQHYSVGGLACGCAKTGPITRTRKGSGCLGGAAGLFRLLRRRRSNGAYLPARHGDLFDPDAYPFLEGRTAESPTASWCVGCSDW